MPSYIVMASPAYGGAEKRFFDIFTTLRRSGDDIYMVAPMSLVDELRRDHPERSDVLTALLSLPLRHWSGAEFIRHWRRLLATLPRGANYHYPLNCLWFLHLARGDRISMSVADCTRVPSPMSPTLTLVLTWTAFSFAHRIDVLSPAIFDRMRRYRNAARMSLTPGGTYLVPPPENDATKRPEILFISRLVPGKGLEDWLALLPAVWLRLRSQVASDFGFRVAGYGPLAPLAEQRCAALAAEGVPVEFVGYARADVEAQRCAVVVSLQRPTNFPSRVVAEALVSGCGVMVRDSGDSRQFGEPPGLQYCGESLEADEVATVLSRLMHEVLHQPGRRQQISAAARERFARPSYVQYFRDILSNASGVAR